jgi:hypothetical protein
VPALCAASIAVLLLFNRRWQLSDGQLGMASGVLLGISFTVLVMTKNKGKSACSLLEASDAKQSGTN